MTKEIKLPRGYSTIVDDADFERFGHLRWHRLGKGYVATKQLTGVTTLLHRAILDVPRGLCVDHINGDVRDNRRENLRIATHRQNMRNVHKQAVSKASTSSMYKGVHFNARRGRWDAHLTTNSKHRYLGSFDTEIEAAHAYDRAAREEYGEFACPNVATDPGLRAPELLHVQWVTRWYGHDTAVHLVTGFSVDEPGPLYALCGDLVDRPTMRFVDDAQSICRNCARVVRVRAWI